MQPKAKILSLHTVVKQYSRDDYYELSAIPLLLRLPYLRCLACPILSMFSLDSMSPSKIVCMLQARHSCCNALTPPGLVNWTMPHGSGLTDPKYLWSHDSPGASADTPYSVEVGTPTAMDVQLST